MFDSLQGLREEHAELQKQLSDSSIHANPGLSKKLNRRYAELNTILAAEENLRAIEADLQAAQELVSEDDSFREELERNQEKTLCSRREITTTSHSQRPR